MKKTLLLSVVASTMIMAGGEISPVETSVEIVATPTNTLAGAFENGKVSGALKAGYSYSNFLGANDSDSILSAGGHLSYETAAYYGFTGGATFQAATTLYDDNNIFPDSTIFNGKGGTPLDSSGAELSEGYLTYTMSKTTLKAGRQYIDTPIVRSAVDGKSSEAIVKDAFAGYVATSSDIQDTVIAAGYVTHYQAQNDGQSNIGDFVNLEGDTYTIYIKNNSIENVTLQAQYLNMTDTLDVAFGQIDYKAGHHTISAQYLQSNNDIRTDDGQFAAIQATGPLGIGQLGYLVAASSSFGDADLDPGAGAGATDTLFTAIPVKGGAVPARANTDTYVAALVLPFSGITTIPYAGISMTDVSAPTENDTIGFLGDVPVVGVMAVYPANKNLLIRANYEHVSTEEVLPAGAAPVIQDQDSNIIRMYATYSF